jgi:hypothetical protein
MTAPDPILVSRYMKEIAAAYNVEYQDEYNQAGVQQIFANSPSEYTPDPRYIPQGFPVAYDSTNHDIKKPLPLEPEASAPTSWIQPPDPNVPGPSRLPNEAANQDDSYKSPVKGPNTENDAFPTVSQNEPAPSSLDPDFDELERRFQQLKKK